MILETDRLRLKALSREDLEDFYDYASNPSVGNSSLWKPHENLEESKNILEEFVLSEEFFGIHHKLDEKMIGIIGLHQDELRTLDKTVCREIGYGINYKYWNKGYMTEAASEVIRYGFEELNLKIMTGTTSKRNTRSQNVMTKLNMKKEGILRMGWQDYKGQLQDKYCYSILREEFLQDKE